MSKQLTIAVVVVIYYSAAFTIDLCQSIDPPRSNASATSAPSIKRSDESTGPTSASVDDFKEAKEDASKGETMIKAAATSHRKSINGLRKPPTITIPIKNAVVQALTPVDRNEADAAQHSPSRHSTDLDGSLGEIIYEDELPGEIGEWIPPPPPPPEHLFRRPSSYAPPVAASTFSRLTGISRHPGSSARLFGDDFALFLVILTIAGFFGLMLAMFMPFTFLLQQQPISVAPYPTGQYGSAYGQYGYPYGRRRRRRRNAPSTPIAWSMASQMGLADLMISSFFRALSQYEELNNKLTQGTYESSKFVSLANTFTPSTASASPNAVKIQTRG